MRFARPAVVERAAGKFDSCDFWLNPTNPQTHGISYFSTSYFSITPSEIKRLFPNCSYEFQRITLAPPIARRLVPLSWGLCLFLESLKIFNSIPFGDTHYLAVIRPKMPQGGTPAGGRLIIEQDIANEDKKAEKLEQIHGRRHASQS